MTIRQVGELFADNRVLIIKEGDKHQPSQYIATDITEFRNALCQIVKNRKKCYTLGETPKLPELTDEQIARLPEGKIKQYATIQQDDYKKALKCYEKDCEDTELAEQALKGNVVAALKLLQSRSDYEYEDFEIEIGRKAPVFKEEQ